jgi:hypothetical protein
MIMKKIVIPAVLAATVLVAGMFAFMPVEKAATVHSTILAQDTFVVESDNLAGLPGGALRPFIDTTPSTISMTHITITDATEDCGNGTAPTSVQVLVGIAGGTLTNVMTGATNTGIGTDAQCVFHAEVTPGSGGVPAGATDIVVVNNGEGDLTDINTITVSAEVNT